jgi:hypothetical protein
MTQARQNGLSHTGREALLYGRRILNFASMQAYSE